MASAAVLGLGTSMTGPAGAIAEITEIAFAGITRDSVDVTSHQSTAPAKEFIPGMVDGATVDITANFLPSNSTQVDLQTNLQDSGAISAIARFYTVVWSSGKIWQFYAFVTHVEPMSKFNDKMTAKVSFKITRSIVSA